ncbi:MAG: D-alanyl-D-alanine carboxypeptidase family protein [Pseudomonadota bacterium]
MIRTLLFLFVAFAFTPAYALETKAKQAYVVDFTTGQTLLSKNADERMPTSSMSKVMTTYTVLDAIKSGKISMDTKFVISKKASEKGGSKMFIAEGTSVSVEDLLRGVIIQSGNDATIALAEGISGDEDSFAKKITQKAKDIGMHNTNFMNASGWPDENHYSTAEDLSVMARRLIIDFPEYYPMFSETEFTYSDITQKNRNPLLYADMGADGMKTGHTEAAGYGLIGTAIKDERRVVMVINGLESEADRKSESKRIIQWALTNFKNKKILEAGQDISTAPVAYGAEESVLLTVNDDLLMTLKSSDKARFEVKYKSPVVAPVTKGQEIGTLVVKAKTLEEPLEVPLLAKNDVAGASFIDKTMMKLKYLIRGTL